MVTHKTFVKLLFLSAVLIPSISFSAPLFIPGQTLNPGCLPSNPDCTVSTTTVFFIDPITLSFAHGSTTLASGYYSHSEGQATLAAGTSSHAEGANTQALDWFAHATGLNTIAAGYSSNASGIGSIASGTASFAGGQGTDALGYASYAVGIDSVASGNAALASGQNTLASGNFAFTSGIGTQATGQASFAAGTNSIASGDHSFASGINTIASAFASYVAGLNSVASGTASFASGQNTVASGFGSFAEGQFTTASGAGSHAEGQNTQATGGRGHAEGLFTTASGNNSHAEGNGAIASGDQSHAQGNYTTASGFAAFSAGTGSLASGDHSFAGGLNTQALGYASYATGINSITSGTASFAWGQNTQATNYFSYAGGLDSTASGHTSFAQGNNAHALHANSTVFSDSSGATSTAINQMTLSFLGGVVLNPNGGNVAVDTDTLFVDSVNNRVGINTVAPDGVLDIANGGFIVRGATTNMNIVPAMTGDTTPRGTVFYSSQFGGGLLAQYAFDHNSTIGWASVDTVSDPFPQYIGYQFISAKTITSYSLNGWVNSAARAPLDWTFEGSNDGSSWTILDTRSGETGWGNFETRNYSISSPAAYTYYRVNISANNGDSFTETNEIEMFGNTLSDFQVGVGTSTPDAALSVVSAADLPYAFSVYTADATIATGSAIILNTGKGASTTTPSALAFDAGNFSIITGAGGDSTGGGGTGGKGGDMSIILGAGGVTSSGGGGAGGSFSVVAGDGASSIGAGAAGNISLTAGNGAAGMFPSAGGSVTITAGAGALGLTPSAGGNILLMPGAPAGNGVAGNVGIGTLTPDHTLTVAGTIFGTISSSSQISEVATASIGPSPYSYPYSIAVSGRYAYTTNIGDDTLSVIDISNPKVPVQIATTTLQASPQSIAIAGQYAYVLNWTSYTMSVVDISNPSAPTQITTTSVGTNPQDIVLSGHYAYITNSGGNTISVVDISNPSAPTQITTVSSGGSNPYGIVVSGKYLYVTNLGDSTLSIIDISSPSVPTLINTVSIGVNPIAISVSGRYAYVANNNGNSISVVDISNPGAPVEVATTSVGSLPYSIAVSGRYAYTANYNDNTISIIDISNPLIPVQIATTPVGISPNAITISGKYAYVTNYNDGNISVVDLAGVDVGNLLAGAVEAGNINIQNNIDVAGLVNIGTALAVGSGGIKSDGSLSITASTSISANGNFVLNTNDGAGHTSTLFDNGTDHHFGGSAYLDMNEGGGGNYTSTLTSIGRLYLISQTDSIDMQSTTGLTFNSNGASTIQMQLNDQNFNVLTSDPTDNSAGMNMNFSKNQAVGGFNSADSSSGGFNINNGQAYLSFYRGSDGANANMAVYPTQFGGYFTDNAGSSGSLYIQPSGLSLNTAQGSGNVSQQVNTSNFYTSAFDGSGGSFITNFNPTQLYGYFSSSDTSLGQLLINNSEAYSSFTNGSTGAAGSLFVYPSEFGTTFSNGSGNSGYMYVEDSGTIMSTVNTSLGNTQATIQPNLINFLGQDISGFNIGFGQDQANFFVQDASGTRNFLIDPNTILGETIIYSTGSVAFLPGNGGKVGIGTTTPTANLTIEGTPTTTLLRLVNIGAGSLTSDASGNIINTSDERLKDIQGNYTKGLAEIEQLTPINYTWKSETGLDASTTYSGFSAQNVQSVIPEAIGKNGAGFLTLNDRPIIAALVNAVKQIGSFIVKIENGITYLKNIAIGTNEKPEGITMFDRKTGQPYCVIIDNGILVDEPGVCGTQSSINNTATVGNSVATTPTDTGTTTATSTATSTDEILTDTASSTIDISTSTSATDASSTDTSIPFIPATDSISTTTTP